jgi:predicted metal-binding membrane protein
MLPAEALRLRNPVDRGLLAGSTLLFVISAGGTVAWCLSMSGGMSMPGGWTMSMAWMRMPGQSWAVTAAGFLGMWSAMMVAMMLPALVLALGSYRRSIAVERSWGPTLLVGLGYFSVWVALGAAIFPLGVGVALAAMRWERAASVAPVAAGALLMGAGWVQLTDWKARLLRRCRRLPGCTSGFPDAWTALGHGVRLGLICVPCCAGFTLTLLVLGVMDIRVMGLVAAAITLERMVPWPVQVARVSGGLIIGIGLLMFGGVLPLA